MRSRIALLSVAMFLASTQLNFGQDAKRDTDKIQGKWKVVDFVSDGKKIDAAIGQSITFAANKMTVEIVSAGNRPKSFAFKLDEKTKPKSMHMTALDGDFEGKMNAGIYRFDGADLVLCIPNDPDKKDRPKEFDSKKGSRNVLITLKREKN